jgi:hypothetical protein
MAPLRGAFTGISISCAGTGNTFRDSRSVDKKLLVGDLQSPGRHAGLFAGLPTDDGITLAAIPLIILLRAPAKKAAPAGLQAAID